MDYWIYIAGSAGFVGGFSFGQMVLWFLLRHKSTEELLHNKNLRLQYGIMCWGIAVLGAWAFVEMYKVYFP